MECNKDEAKRAKEIAEKKFIENDIAGAKKFALKAQSLYPGIEGIHWMLATFDVYIAVENKVNGGLDWYGILGASPGDDDETVKRKYKKLALMLHPDRNKFIGAEGAFKHVAEAWKFLSDKEKRATYDRKRSLRTVYQKASVSSADSGFCNLGKSSFTADVIILKNNVQMPVRTATNGSSQAPKVGQAGEACSTNSSSYTAKPGSNTVGCGPSNSSKLDAFWTICPRCMSQYTYLRMYINLTTSCPNCRQSFLAVERPPGISTHRSSSSHKQNQKSATRNSVSVSHNHTTGTFSKTSCPARAAAVVQRAPKKVRKEQEEAQTAPRKEECLWEKKTRRRNTEFSPDNAPKRKKVSETCGSQVTYQLNSFTINVEKIVQKPVCTATNGPSQPQKTGQAGSTISSSFIVKHRSSTAVPSPSKVPKLDTFCTICPRCTSQYQYLRIYVNRSRSCPNCRQSFLAVERPLLVMPISWSSSSQKQNLKSATSNSTSSSHDHVSGTFSGTSSTAHAASVVQRDYEKVKKEQEDIQADARKEEYLREQNARRRSTESSPGNAPNQTKVSEPCGSKVIHQLSSFTINVKNTVQKPIYTAINGSSQAQKTGQAGSTISSLFTAKQGCSSAVPGASKGLKLDTFCTICPRCMSQYQYLRIYVNRSRMCPNCRQSFLAVERPLPGMSTRSYSFSSQKQNQKSATRSSNSSSHNHTTRTFSRTSCAAHAAAASGVQRAPEKVRNEREEARAAPRKEEYLRKNNIKRRSTEFSPDNACKWTKAGETCGSKVTYQLISFTINVKNNVQKPICTATNGSSQAHNARQAGPKQGSSTAVPSDSRG